MKKKLSTGAGIPIVNDQQSQTTGKEIGYTMLGDHQLTEKLAHFNRERVPERVVHAKGTGAYGYFEVTKDLSAITAAKFLHGLGKKTELFARFSTVGGEQGSSDTARDPRGFALKFYTEEGNYDMVGNNIPIFFIRDVIKFPDFIHTQKRNPQTGLKDANMFWDFLSLTPESLHQATFLFTDRGTPYSLRHMHGFSSHTFMFYNEKQEISWFKLHFKTDQGIKNHTAAVADELSGTNPDSHREDLSNAIEKGDFPSWTVYMQHLTTEEVKHLSYDPFDVTKVWRHKDAPLIPIGKMVLNKNPINFFAEVEQSAFSPANTPPGIAPSPDKLLQGRLFAYEDAHRYRVGINAHQIPVNKAKHADVYNNERDGHMQVLGNHGKESNYFPTTIGDYEESTATEMPPISLDHGVISKHPIEGSLDDFLQVGDFWRDVLDESERKSLVSNISGHMKDVKERIKYRQTALFYLADPAYGEAVANALSLQLDKVNELAAMDFAARKEATLRENWK